MIKTLISSNRIRNDRQWNFMNKLPENLKFYSLFSYFFFKFKFLKLYLIDFLLNFFNLNNSNNV